MVERRVLDASALLALVFEEPGADVIAQRLEEDAVMSAVNWAEVLSRLVDEGASESLAHHRLGLLREAHELQVIAFDEALARESAALREVTRVRGLSLGDRACLALARSLGVPAVTADHKWLEFDAGVAVELIR
jgi:ribonuclease VapC